MNQEGLRAFEAAHKEHMERPTYAELYKIVAEKARQHNVRCRLDAIHFLTLNFEFMVAEPLGQQRSGTMAAVLNPELRYDVDRDLDMLLSSIDVGGAEYRLGANQVQYSEDQPKPVDPSRSENEAPRGVSSGKMLKHVAENYDSMHISRWRLWG